MTDFSEDDEHIETIRERHKNLLDEVDKGSIDYLSERNSILASEAIALEYAYTLDRGQPGQTLVFAISASRAALKASLDTRLLLQGQAEAIKILKEIRVIVAVLGAVAVGAFVQSWL